MLVSLCSDDKVEEDKLATSFDVSCRVWQVSDLTIIRVLEGLNGTLYHY